MGNNITKSPALYIGSISCSSLIFSIVFLIIIYFIFRSLLIIPQTTLETAKQLGSTIVENPEILKTITEATASAAPLALRAAV